MQEIGTGLRFISQFCKTGSGSWLKPNVKTLWEQSFTVLALLDNYFVSQSQRDEIWLGFCKSMSQNVELSWSLPKRVQTVIRFD